MVNYELYAHVKDSNYKEKKEKSESNYDYIWETIPIYRDIYRARITGQSISIILVLSSIGILIFLITLNWVFTLGIIGLLSIIYLGVFHKDIFSLQHLFHKTSLTPFPNTIFYQSTFRKDIVFMTNLRDNITCGLKVFKIEIMAENVHAYLNSLIKVLANQKVAYTYQVIQRRTDLSSEGSSHLPLRTEVYFCAFSFVEGSPTVTRIERLVNRLETDVAQIHSNSVNFHHFKFLPISKSELLTAFRTILIPEINEERYTITPQEIVHEKKVSTLEIALKSAIIFGISLLLVLLLNVLSFVDEMIAFLFGCASFLLLSLNWNRSLLRIGKYLSVLKTDQITTIDLFPNSEFFQLPSIPDTLFYYQEGQVLGGIKMFNLAPVELPPFCNPGKFYEALTAGQFPYTLTLHLHPLLDIELKKDALKHFNGKNKYLINHLTEAKRKNWLNQRLGLWNVVGLLSTSFNMHTTSKNVNKISTIENELIIQSRNLEAAFNNGFYNYKLIPLSKNHLISAFETESVKHKYFRRNGSSLIYFILQGRIVTTLAMISEQFKKGMPTKIGAEFNSPSYLKNKIEIGKIINTETLSLEAKAGFNSEQVKSLLLTNGTVNTRNLTAMKIVSELIQNGVPSIIFDFSGDWSRLIRYFGDSAYSNKFLFFKLGKTFILNPFKSDIPYDGNNVNYLDYMFDAMALSFKKDAKTMEFIRNTFIHNATKAEVDKEKELSFETMKIGITNQPRWEKSSIASSVVAFLEEFTPRDIEFLGTPGAGEQKLILVPDFVKDDKTIILDLSGTIDNNKKGFFAWMIISKIIHYLTSGKTYVPKILVVPSVDVIFDGFFLDKHIRYGKIDKFLKPLVEHNFGLIFGASQIHYLHHNVFNYLTNIITFKATDSRDMQTLKNIMNLDTLHGKGIYSNRRNETYQNQYISVMKPNEAVVKRQDVDQPFPIQIDFKELTSFPPLIWEDTITYMENQGYDVKLMEQIIIKASHKTILEKDFGDLKEYVSDIINLLNVLSVLDDIGHIYKSTIIEQLKIAIHDRVVKNTKDKKRQKQIREELFNILTRQGYLIENHPKRAGGTEEIRTSYAVGTRFKTACEEYYSSQQKSPSIIALEEQISDEDLEIIDSTEKESINIINLKTALAENIPKLYVPIYITMGKYINKGQFPEALNVTKGILRTYLLSVYQSIYIVNYAISDNDIQALIHTLSNVEGFPLAEVELSNLMNKCDSIPSNIEFSFLTELCEEIQKEYQDLYVKLLKFLEE